MSPHGNPPIRWPRIHSPATHSTGAIASAQPAPTRVLSHATPATTAAV